MVRDNWSNEGMVSMDHNALADPSHTFVFLFIGHHSHQYPQEHTGYRQDLFRFSEIFRIFGNLSDFQNFSDFS